VTRDLRQVFALAGAFKQGDLAVGGTADDRLRDEARRALLATTVGQIRRTPLVEDGVSDALERTRDRRFDGDLDALTIARVRDTLLGPGLVAWAEQHRDALPSDAIAAAAKVMTAAELSSVSRALFNPLGDGQAAIGTPRHFGSRIQPNSPGDDEQEILFSVFEGLSFGCGDVIIGLNPAADEVGTIVRLERLLAQVVERLDLPTHFCVLSDIVKQDSARQYAPIDVAFQSLAGTSRALAGMVGLDVDGLVDLAHGFDRLYFETGQGSEVTNGTAEGVDMVTLEARTYGVARHLRRALAAGRGQPPWAIVNDVAGFIGPEVFTTAAQLERACLEDAAMAKLHGLTMGLDVCATFHMGIAPAALRVLTAQIVERAAPAYLMAVAGNADPMLGYLTTSFRQHPLLRDRARRRMTSPMEERLKRLGALTDDGSARPGIDSVIMGPDTAEHFRDNLRAFQNSKLDDRERAALEKLRAHPSFVALKKQKDEEAGKKSVLGGLAASGWFTAGLWMRAYVDGVLSRADGLGSPGGEEISWPAPVFAGDELRAAMEVLETRHSRSRPELGLVRLRATMHRADALVFSSTFTGMFQA